MGGWQGKPGAAAWGEGSGTPGYGPTAEGSCRVGMSECKCHVALCCLWSCARSPLPVRHSGSLGHLCGLRLMADAMKACYLPAQGDDDSRKCLHSRMVDLSHHSHAQQ